MLHEFTVTYITQKDVIVTETGFKTIEEAAARVNVLKHYKHVDLTGGITIELARARA